MDEFRPGLGFLCCLGWNGKASASFSLECLLGYLWMPMEPTLAPFQDPPCWAQLVTYICYL